MANKEHRHAGGTAWWCPDVMNPVAVYVQGMGYNSTGAQYAELTKTAPYTISNLNVTSGGLDI